MSADMWLLFLLGVLFGAAVAHWRTWAYARKLLHLGVSLDAFSDYDEKSRQAHGQSKLAAVRDISERRSDR